MGMRAGQEGAATPVGERPLHWDAVARLHVPWRGCAGRYFRVPSFGSITRFARPAPRPPLPPRRGPSPRPAGRRMGMRGARKALAAMGLHARDAITSGWL
jgi:hypothetical protein